MNDDLITPEIGTTCPALKNEDYKYHLSGDCEKFCICYLNSQPCTGRVISDPDDKSSQFFSRRKCSISKEGLERCPVYGVSRETMLQILKEKQEMEINNF